MKNKLILIFLFVFIISCNKTETYTIEVTYQNNDKQIFNFESYCYPYVDRGDLRYCNGRAVNIAITSGIRNFKVIKKQ